MKHGDVVRMVSLTKYEGRTVLGGAGSYAVVATPSWRWPYIRTLVRTQAIIDWMDKNNWSARENLGCSPDDLAPTTEDEADQVRAYVALMGDDPPSIDRWFNDERGNDDG